MFTERTELLIGAEATARLNKARVIIFGLGGVGGMTAEALVRAGVGAITAVDDAEIKESNLNRQILADLTTLGIPKTEAFRCRAANINPQCEVTTVAQFVSEQNIDKIISDFLQPAAVFDKASEYVYAADAVDTVAAKLAIVNACRKFGLPFISCMGTGNKLDPSLFRVADIYSTKVCPLCRVMRAELKKAGVDALQVVYSEEPPSKTIVSENGRHAPASISFVPPAAGLLMAAEIVRKLIF